MTHLAIIQLINLKKNYISTQHYFSHSQYFPTILLEIQNSLRFPQFHLTGYVILWPKQTFHIPHFKPSISPITISVIKFK